MVLGAGLGALLVPLDVLELHAGAEALRAPSMLGVIGKKPRIELAEAASARGARALHREHLHFAIAPSAAAHVQHALAHLQRRFHRRAQLLFVVGADLDLGDRQLDGVLAESVEARPALGRQVLAVHAQVRDRFGERPFREVGVLHQARDDDLDALRLDRHVAVGAVLRAQLHEQQAQEMVDLGLCRDRALRAAAAGALLDGDRRRNAEDRVDVGLRRRLHELARIGVQRFEVAALPLCEKDVERQGGLARARDAGDHRELVARDLDVDAFQVVLPRMPHADGVMRAQIFGNADYRRWTRRLPPISTEGFLVVDKSLAGV